MKTREKSVPKNLVFHLPTTDMWKKRFPDQELTLELLKIPCQESSLFHQLMGNWHSFLHLFRNDLISVESMAFHVLHCKRCKEGLYWFYTEVQKEHDLLENQGKSLEDKKRIASLKERLQKITPILEPKKGGG